MTESEESLEFLKTSIKALVMAIKRTSEFPTDDDLITALTDKLFLGEQALALEMSSQVVTGLSKTADTLVVESNRILGELREKLDENRQNTEVSEK